MKNDTDLPQSVTILEHVQKPTKQRFFVLGAVKALAAPGPFLQYLAFYTWYSCLLWVPKRVKINTNILTCCCVARPFALPT